MVQFPAGKVIDSYTIPDNVKFLLIHAFYGNQHISEVTIPASVTVVDLNPFIDCKNLETIKIQQSSFPNPPMLMSTSLPFNIDAIFNT